MRATKIPSPSNKPDRDSTPLCINEIFKLSKALVFLPPGCSKYSKRTQKNQVVPERKPLSFFQSDVCTYAITRTLQHVPEAAEEKALRSLLRESSELVSCMISKYNLTLDVEKSSVACLFPSEQRWLKGEKYAFLIRHYYAYSKLLNLYPLNERHHPNSIYD